MTNEHNPAGGSFAKIIKKWRTDTNDDAHSISLWDQGYAYGRQECADELEALAAIHCAQGEVDPLTQYAADFIDGWIEGESEEVKRNWTRVRKAVLAPPSQPADKPAGQAVTDARSKITALLNGRIRSTLLDTSNGIDSPASMSTAAQAVCDIDRIEKLLAALAPEPATAGERFEVITLGVGHAICGRSKTYCMGPELLSDDTKRNIERLLNEATPAAAVPDGMVLVKAYASCGQYADDQPGTRAECSARIKMGDPCERCPRRVAAPANRPADAQRNKIAKVLDLLDNVTAETNTEAGYLFEARDRVSDMVTSGMAGVQREELVEVLKLLDNVTAATDEAADCLGQAENMLSNMLASSPADPLPASEVSP